MEQHDLNKMLLAAQVRQIAAEKRTAMEDLARGLAARNGRHFDRHDWNVEHPVTGFVPQAFAELVDVANLMWPPS